MKIKPGYLFFSQPSSPVSHFTLNERNVPFLNSVKYLGVIFYRGVTWRLHIEIIETKAFRTFIRVYSLLKSVLKNLLLVREFSPHTPVIFL
jgi:hypothetical protein